MFFAKKYIFLNCCSQNQIFRINNNVSPINEFLTKRVSIWELWAHANITKEKTYVLPMLYIIQKTKNTNCKKTYKGDNNMYAIQSETAAAVTQFLQKSLRMQSCDNLAFCTIRFNKPKKDVFYAKENARSIYSRMFNQLQGKYWHKHPLPSVTIIEHGKTNVFHVHSVINLCEYTLPKLDIALSNTCYIYPYLNLTYDMQYTLFENFNNSTSFHNFSPVMNHLLVRKVYNRDIFNYISKEYNFNSNKIDFANLWTSEMLFKLH